MSRGSVSRPPSNIHRPPVHRCPNLSLFRSLPYRHPHIYPCILSLITHHPQQLINQSIKRKQEQKVSYRCSLLLTIKSDFRHQISEIKFRKQKSFFRFQTSLLELYLGSRFKNLYREQLFIFCLRFLFFPSKFHS